MDYSANLLSATGSCEFNLPTWWLPDRDGASDEGSGGSEGGDSLDIETGSKKDEHERDYCETAGSEEDERGDEGEGLQTNSTDEDDDDRVLPTVGHLFFRSRLRSFLKISKYIWDPAPGGVLEGGGPGGVTPPGTAAVSKHETRYCD